MTQKECCFKITWKRGEPETKITLERGEPETKIKWMRTCDVFRDLIPFSAQDGAFLTNEGYVILVKI